MARVKFGFSRFAVSAKILRARYVVSSMTGNPNYATLPPNLMMPTITAAIDLLESTAQAALKGGTDKTLARNVAEAALSDLMNQLQDYVQVASGGDPIIIESSGMEVANERVPAVLLSAVQNAAARPGGNEGEIIVTWNGMPGAKSYVVEMLLPQDKVTPLPVPGEVPAPGGEVVMTTGSEWMRIDTVTKRNLTVKALESGKRYSFRIAAINSAGQGDYSQTVSSVAR